jgi:predicted PurR-regulated permease PerM
MAKTAPPPFIQNPLRESLRVLGLYVRAQILIAAVVTVLYGIGFALAHVPWWLLIAILGGLTSFLPHVGPLVPLALVALTNLIADRNLDHLLIAFAVWVAIQILVSFVLTPRLLGRPLGLKPLPVFIVLLAASLMAGPLGFFLAVPALAVANVFWRYLRQKMV